MGAAAAWERNGSLDAISRAFSYIFARPLQFFWNDFRILLFTSVILIAGAHFERILVKSVDAGLVSEAPSMLIDTPAQMDDNWSNDTKNLARSVEEKTRGARPFAISFDAVVQAPWGHKLTILIFWAILNIIRFGVFATAIWWFFGATTSTYADLRADVDGTEEDEIYLEEEEEDFEGARETRCRASEHPARASGDGRGPAASRAASAAHGAPELGPRPTPNGAHASLRDGRHLPRERRPSLIWVRALACRENALAKAGGRQADARRPPTNSSCPPRGIATGPCPAST